MHSCMCMLDVLKSICFEFVEWFVWERGVDFYVLINLSDQQDGSSYSTQIDNARLAYTLRYAMMYLLTVKTN